jgi:hypothetical protein
MKRLLAASVAALLMVSLVSSVAMAAPKATGLWSVFNINAAGTAYVPTPAPGNATSLANFTFPSTATTALLTTTQTPSLLGNLTGKAITATFTVTASGDAVFISDGSCGSSATYVRFYFEVNNNGKFFSNTASYTDYWWSNPTSTSYTFVNGTTATVTLTVPLNIASWSDWGGEQASAVPTYFAAAVKHVGMIGLSFGGGCFFANGVGVNPGTASFTLTSYTVG